MFAVLKTGGKQYKVHAGDVLRIEKLDAAAGETIQFNDILMLGGDTAQLGTPMIDGAAVQAEVLDQIKGDKTIHFVKRRRKHSSKRRKGHRQQLTLVRITDILASGGADTGVKAAIGGGDHVAFARADRDPMAHQGRARSAAADVLNEILADDDADALHPEDSFVPTEEPANGDVVDTAVDAPQPDASQTAATAENTAQATAETAAEVAEPEAGQRPENLLAAPRDGGADDLTRISGVGETLVELLNANGVYHFDQIAAWGPDEIAYMDEKLSFKGRIEREEWVSQAQALATEQED